MYIIILKYIEMLANIFPLDTRAHKKINKVENFSLLG